eukprot:COSAG04_NODE_2551_length_3948_cov_326.824370_1_plen_802_part_00
MLLAAQKQSTDAPATSKENPRPLQRQFNRMMADDDVTRFLEQHHVVNTDKKKEVAIISCETLGGLVDSYNEENTGSLAATVDSNTGKVMLTQHGRNIISGTLDMLLVEQNGDMRTVHVQPEHMLAPTVAADAADARNPYADPEEERDLDFMLEMQQQLTAQGHFPQPEGQQADWREERTRKICRISTEADLIQVLTERLQTLITAAVTRQPDLKKQNLRQGIREQVVEIWTLLAPLLPHMQIGKAQPIVKIKRGIATVRNVINLKQVFLTMVSKCITAGCNILLEAIATHPTYSQYCDIIAADPKTIIARLMQAVENIEHLVGAGTPIWIVVLDFKNYFPSIVPNSSAKALIDLCKRLQLDINKMHVVKSPRKHAAVINGWRGGEHRLTPTFKFSLAMVAMFIPIAQQLCWYRAGNSIFADDKGITQGGHHAAKVADLYGLWCKLEVVDMIKRRQQSSDRIFGGKQQLLKYSARVIDDIAWVITDDMRKSGFVKWISRQYENLTGITLEQTQPDENTIPGFVPYCGMQVSTRQMLGLHPEKGRKHQTIYARIYTKPNSTISIKHAKSSIQDSTNTANCIQIAKRIFDSTFPRDSIRIFIMTALLEQAMLTLQQHRGFTDRHKEAAMTAMEQYIAKDFSDGFRADTNAWNDKFSPQEEQRQWQRAAEQRPERLFITATQQHNNPVGEHTRRILRDTENVSIVLSRQAGTSMEHEFAAHSRRQQARPTDETADTYATGPSGRRYPELTLNRPMTQQRDYDEQTGIYSDRIYFNNTNRHRTMSAQLHYTRPGDRESQQQQQQPQ